MWEQLRPMHPKTAVWSSVDHLQTSQSSQPRKLNCVSARTGASPISSEEEIRRVLPVIERVVQQTSTPISVDTTKAEVARCALDAGAVIINDVSGLTEDRDMPSVCAHFRAGVICMHR